ncbi:unnamed protein product [Rhizoctonia solani]|uniref:Kex protein n=1 Tax=Rhizoctonia solani TaxID=456999 RepID=A0A8H3GK69_9AGAM|nr:unnamed protein product [Rhizoctonia solani]
MSLGSSNLDMFDYFYRVEVKSMGRVPGGRIYENQMPRIWLVNLEELRLTPNLSWYDIAKVREYVLPMSLLARSHLASETTLITRRFLASSIMKDVILKSKPLQVYKGLSLYPIGQSSVTVLNISDENIATTSIRPRLSPGLMHYRKQTDINVLKSPPSDALCDYIEDYRSGSVIDVIGSIGGLFALLQAAHLLLFGRPLLWSLTGAKTVTPFGVLGQCSSQSFKRRLRREYHTPSGEDGTDTIQIVKFLRDFVIEFGPADLDSENSSSGHYETASPAVRFKESDAAGTQM